MIEQTIKNSINNYSYITLYGLTFSYFMMLYFIIGPLFLYCCRSLSKKNIIQQIVGKEATKSQIKSEIRNSLKSIFIFGFSGIPLVYFIRIGTITLLPDTVFNIISGLVILTIWNEVHFFVIHRIMHIPVFMKSVHYVHHRSKTPTIYSVYSFHWLEALLLSTVQITISPFIPFSPIAILLYPFVSILFNFSGHCNYRFGNGTGPDWKIFGTRHAEHHFKNKQVFGFATSVLDKIYSLSNAIHQKGKFFLRIKRTNNE